MVASGEAGEIAGGDGSPTADEFLEALTRLQWDKQFAASHEAMLVDLYAAPDRSRTAGELARAAGWDSYEAANAHLGRFARLLALETGRRPTKAGTEDPASWTYILATAAPERSPEGHFRWRMRPEFAEAFGRFQQGRAAS
jgi:hypothetical protein